MLTKKPPTLCVPAWMFLVLVRAYKERPQEQCDRKVWIEADALERRAYRKMMEGKKNAKP